MVYVLLLIIEVALCAALIMVCMNQSSLSDAFSIQEKRLDVIDLKLDQLHEETQQTLALLCDIKAQLAENNET